MIYVFNEIYFIDKNNTFFLIFFNLYGAVGYERGI